MITYEYAGFEYEIRDGGPEYGPVAIPIPGLHRAASKDKHCRAAADMWMEEQEATAGKKS